MLFYLLENLFPLFVTSRKLLCFLNAESSIIIGTYNINMKDKNKQFLFLDYVKIIQK